MQTRCRCRPRKDCEGSAQASVGFWLQGCTCVASLRVALSNGARPLGDLRGQRVEGSSHRLKALGLLFVYEVRQLGLLCLEGYHLCSLQRRCSVLPARSEKCLSIFGLHSNGQLKSAQSK